MHLRKPASTSDFVATVANTSTESPHVHEQIQPLQHDTTRDAPIQGPQLLSAKVEVKIHDARLPR